MEDEELEELLLEDDCDDELEELVEPLELDQEDELLDHTLLDEEFHCDEELYQLEEELGPIDEELEYHVEEELGQYEELLGHGKLDDDIQPASNHSAQTRKVMRKCWMA